MNTFCNYPTFLGTSESDATSVASFNIDGTESIPVTSLSSGLVVLSDRSGSEVMFISDHSTLLNCPRDPSAEVCLPIVCYHVTVSLIFLTFFSSLVALLPSHLVLARPLGV